MKKCMIIVISIFILILNGCTMTSRINKTAFMEPIKLTSSQKELTKGLGINNSDIIHFRFADIPTNINNMELWCEYYDSGKLVNKLFCLEQGIDKKGTIIGSFYNINGIERFVINGSSFTREEDKFDQKVSTSMLNDKRVAIKEGQEIILMVKVENEGNISPISDDVFSDFSNEIEQLIENDHVYVIKCMFHTTDNKGA
ncbi:MAG: hypothetical protein CVU84_02265 [Firmicutes bacterium HGW-Firmicutes-1]|nr:MAG: hypothetical protein CVU84_02265 [Firmicutes bacterium HGW-Firmicutes-1]